MKRTQQHTQMQEDKCWEDLFFDPAQEGNIKPPHVEFDQWLVNGEIRKWTGETCDVHSPILIKGSGHPTVIGYQRIDLGPQDLNTNNFPIGSYAMLTEKEAVEAVQSAQQAYNGGRGVWPQTPVTSASYGERISHPSYPPMHR